MTRTEARDRILAYLATVAIATVTLWIELAVVPTDSPNPAPPSFDALTITILVATALLIIGLSLWASLTGVVHIVRPLSLASTSIAIGGLVLVATIALLVGGTIIETGSFSLDTWRLLLDQPECRIPLACGLAVFCTARVARWLAEGR